MLNFAESGHPIFRATSALGRGELRSKGKGKKSIHFNSSEANIELTLRTVISVNQLSSNGAMADLCKKISKDSDVAGKLAARFMNIKIEQLTEDQKIVQIVLRRWFEDCCKRTILHYICCRTGHSTHKTHLCSTVCSQARNAHHALGSREQPKHDLHFIFVRLKRVFVIWCVAHVSSMVALTCLSPRAHHLPHSHFLVRHKNTQHNRYNKSNSEITQYITRTSKLPQSTSSAVKNHSGVKTCRVAETRARQLPQVMSPKSLRMSQGSKIFWRSISYDVQEKFGEEDCFNDLEDNRSISITWCTKRIWRAKSPSSDHRRSVGIWRERDSWLTGLSNISDVLLPIADAFWRFRGNHWRFRSRRWRVTKDAEFITVCPESFGETRCNGHAGERGKCTNDSSRKRKLEVSLIWRSDQTSHPTEHVVANKIPFRGSRAPTANHQSRRAQRWVVMLGWSQKRTTES